MATTGDIKTVLQDARVMAVQDIMDHHEASAQDAQKASRNFSLIFILATSVAALAAALILFGAGAAEADNAHPIAEFINRDTVRNLLYVIEVGALAATAFAAHVQETRQHSARWGAHRRNAEETRIELYDTILAVAAQGDQSTKTAAFEHFLTGQLDGQLRYFERGKTRHDKRASRFALYGALIAVAVAVAGYGGYSDKWLPAAALAGVIAPIFLTALNSWRDSGGDAEKAARYSDVWTSLRRLKGQSIVVRDALTNGDDDAATAFVVEVHDVLRNEINVWTQNLENRANG